MDRVGQHGDAYLIQMLHRPVSLSNESTTLGCIFASLEFSSEFLYRIACTDVRSMPVLRRTIIKFPDL